LDRWRSLIDLAVVMNVSPSEAMERENSQRISPKPGSIMNLEVLKNISAAVALAVKEYRQRFDSVIEYETSGQNVRLSNTNLASNILDHLSAFLDPEILVVPTRELRKLPLNNGGAFSGEAREELFQCISKFGKFVRRSYAESNPDEAQIISCGLLVHNDEVFLFERKERDPKYSLYGKATIWQGAHVPRVTAKGGEELLQSALLDRISRSLFLSRTFPVDLVGYCWEPNNEKSNRHFGVIFKVDIDNDVTAADLRKKEFRHGRGHGLAGRFVSWKSLTSKAIEPNLEAWSVSILGGVGDIQGLKDAV
jgi:predicted NUDIX family phosphoesterase